MITAAWEYMPDGSATASIWQTKSLSTCCETCFCSQEGGNRSFPGWQGGSSILALLCHCAIPQSVYPLCPNVSKTTLPLCQSSAFTGFLNKKWHLCINCTQGFFFHSFVSWCLKVADVTSCGKKYHELNHKIYKSILNL